MLLVIALFTLVLILYWITITRPPKNFPPGPSFPPLPILGHAHLLGKDANIGFCRLRDKYGDIYQLQLGPERAVVLNDFTTIQEVMAKDVFSARFVPASHRIMRMADGVLPEDEAPGVGVSSGQKWLEQMLFYFIVIIFL